MKNSLFSLIAVVLAATLSELLLEGEGGTRRYVRLLTSLLVLLMLAAPLRQVLQHTSLDLTVLLPREENAADFEEIFRQTVGKQGEAELREGIYALLKREFGIERGDCEVRFSFSEEGALSLLSLRLRGAALLQDPREIGAYFSGLLDCETEVR